MIHCPHCGGTSWVVIKDSAVRSCADCSLAIRVAEFIGGPRDEDMMVVKEKFPEVQGYTFCTPAYLSDLIAL